MNVTLVDDFGRRISFDGVKLAQETTDTEDQHKPQWTDILVYKTTGGRYVVWREYQFRVRHASPECTRASNEELVPATPGDTFACNTCNPEHLPGGYGQSMRVKLDVYDKPENLIASLATFNQKTGVFHHSQFGQTILAEISEKDLAVAALWMEVRIP